MSLNLSTSQSLFSHAQQLIPGGVNSPVRAFQAVGGTPVFVKRAEGPYIWDEDGNKYIELINSWGPMILGHSHPTIIAAVQEALGRGFSYGAPTRKEGEMAELICEMVPAAEKVRMVNSGTEATLSAIRVARGYTGRSKIIKFEGCYHGHGDSFLIAAGSGAATLGVPNSPGVTASTAADTLTAIYNDLSSVEHLVNAHANELAAIIIEPVAGNMGLVAPQPGFLEGLRSLCDKRGIVLIFDEVMTGFRLAAGGAHELYGVMPDMVTLGKIIGGGLPVGAYAGKKEIMNMVAPAGPVYQAGTLSGNPIAMAAGFATLSILHEQPEIFKQLDSTGAAVEQALRNALATQRLNYTINRVGSMFTLFFTDKPVLNFGDAKASNLTAFGSFFHHMLNQGVYLAPSQFEALFLSTAIEQEHIRIIEQAASQAFAYLQDEALV